MAQFPTTPPMTPLKNQGSGGQNIGKKAGHGTKGAHGYHPKRYQKGKLETIDNIRRASIRKLARRGGVKRMKQSVYQTTKEVIECKIREVIRRCIHIISPSGRKTISSLDIVYALKDMPSMAAGLNPVYGFGWPVKEFPEPRARKPIPAQPANKDILVLRKRIEAHKERDHRAAPIPTPTPTPASRRTKQVLPVDMPTDDVENDADEEDVSNFDSEKDRRAQIDFESKIRRVAQWVESVPFAHAGLEMQV